MIKNDIFSFNMINCCCNLNYNDGVPFQIAAIYFVRMKDKALEIIWQYR